MLLNLWWRLYSQLIVSNFQFLVIDLEIGTRTKRMKLAKRMFLVWLYLLWEVQPIRSLELVMKYQMRRKTGRSLSVSWWVIILQLILCFPYISIRYIPLTVYELILRFIIGGSQILTPEGFLDNIKELSTSGTSGEEYNE